MSDPVKLRKCKECGKEFEITRKDRRYCCTKCRNKHWVKENPRLSNKPGE